MNSRKLALLLIALFVLVGLAYSTVIPPFETPDEPFHYAFARHVAQGHGLPVQDARATGPWKQEGSQAPLYYLLTGWLTAPINQDDFTQIFVRNPRANIGDPLNPGNKNYILYSGRQPSLQGANLALHVGRWFSLLLGALTLWFTFLTAELLIQRRRVPGAAGLSSSASPGADFPGRLPLLALAFVAVIPQFLFISASFSNDSLVIALSAATIYWLARLLARPGDASIGWWEWVVLGLLLGGAALSKLQGLGLIPLAGAAVLLIAWQRRSWKLLLTAAAGTALPALIVAGWWYGRNIALYGDWSGLGNLTAINGRRARPLTLADFWPEFRGLRFSFWGLFGWFNILLPDWFYLVMDAATVIGLAGAVGAAVGVVRRASRPRLADPALRILSLLFAWGAICLVLLVYWIVQATGSQGRLLFPGLIAFGILLALGINFWLHWAPQLVRRLVWAALFAVMVGASIYALVQLLPSAYAAPAPIAAVPPAAQPVGITFGAAEPIDLLAVDVGAGRYRPGDRAPVTLYYRADQPLHQDYQMFVQFLDENGDQVANLTSHPGWGRNPTSQWQPGAIYADHYDVLVTGPVDRRGPLLARVYTGFIDPTTVDAGNLPLPARGSDGQEITPIVGSIEVAAALQPDGRELGLRPVSAEFGSVLEVVGASDLSAPVAAGRPLTVTLLWSAKRAPDADYTAYVHLIDSAGQQVAGFDRAPAGDRFPVHRWRVGDRAAGDFPVALPADLPPGRYAVWVGLYRTDSAGAQRLPVTDPGGLPTADNQVQIGAVEVK